VASGVERFLTPFADEELKWLIKTKQSTLRPAKISGFGNAAVYNYVF